MPPHQPHQTELCLELLLLVPVQSTFSTSEASASQASLDLKARTFDLSPHPSSNASTRYTRPAPAFYPASPPCYHLPEARSCVHLH
ncbi:hypothetical protein BGT96224_5451, partial [Blumeria graminis f. sp. tritici 96224]